MEKSEWLARVRAKRAFLLDMDGVVYCGDVLLPGVKEFLAWARGAGKRCLFLTNNSFYTPGELAKRLRGMGLEASPRDFYTSAMAAADFCAEQSESPTAWVIGASGLFEALEEAGVRLTEASPEFVIAGESLEGYGFAQMGKALRLVLGGARLLATNADITGPTPEGLIPATGAMVAPLEIASGRKAYVVGKPNAMMFRRALERLGVAASDAVMVGDSMGTDIRGGMESGMTTVLALSGLTRLEDLPRFAYRPQVVVRGLGDLVPEAGA